MQNKATVIPLCDIKFSELKRMMLHEGIYINRSYKLRAGQLTKLTKNGLTNTRNNNAKTKRNRYSVLLLIARIGQECSALLLLKMSVSRLGQFTRITNTYPRSNATFFASPSRTWSTFSIVNHYASPKEWAVLNYIESAELIR